jgi:hypothetical protein
MVLAQQPAPQTPEDAFTTRDLIAWSHLQNPQPVPQPLPQDEARTPQLEQPQDQQSKPPADPHSQQRPAIRITGKIVKDGGQYILQVASANYALDDTGNFEAYESRSVTILGIFNTDTATIHALTIELVS